VLCTRTALSAYRSSHGCRALQEQFNNKEEATGATPSLSVNALTASMTKRHAAKIFYQICGKPSDLFDSKTSLCWSITLSSMLSPPNLTELVSQGNAVFHSPGPD